MEEYKLSKAREIIGQLDAALSLDEATPILKMAINEIVKSNKRDRAIINAAAIRCCNRFDVPMA